LLYTVLAIGSGASPFDCYLALRGSKTLAVRVEKAQSNAMAIGEYLEKHAKIEKVVYPGLKSHPQYELNKRQSRGTGGMLSFYIKGDVKTAERFLVALKVFTLAESLGGVESLIESPAIMTHGSVPADHRKLLGIEDNFIRISVGIEDLKDLLDDIKQALAKA
jgi:cystathionine gamma-lyase